MAGRGGGLRGEMRGACVHHVVILPHPSEHNVESIQLDIWKYSRGGGGGGKQEPPPPPRRGRLKVVTKKMRRKGRGLPLSSRYQRGTFLPSFGQMGALFVSLEVYVLCVQPKGSFALSKEKSKRQTYTQRERDRCRAP